jgi:hypothetical protein
VGWLRGLVERSATAHSPWGIPLEIIRFASDWKSSTRRQQQLDQRTMNRFDEHGGGGSSAGRRMPKHVQIA